MVTATPKKTLEGKALLKKVQELADSPRRDKAKILLHSEAIRRFNGLRLIANQTDATQVMRKLATGDITESELTNWINHNITT
jgi:hypothetical protein